MPYGADLATFLGSSYRFSLDGDAVGEVGGLTGTNSGGIFTRSGICLDVTNCWSSNGTADRIVIPTTGSIDDASGAFGFTMWVSLDDFQLPFCRLFGLGNTTVNRSIILGPGNSIIFEADNGTFGAQRYSDRSLQPGRQYALTWIWDTNGLRGYLDGVEQTIGSDFSQSSVTLSAATPIEVGDPAGTVSMGGIAVVLVSANICDYNELQFFNPTGLTDQEIFDEIFAKGAIAGATVTSQAQLDALADTLRPNEPVNIRVDVAGSINLTADNITHDALASCHVHYTGSGICNWTNANGSNASIGSAPSGTLNFINPATFTIAGLINGCEVRIYEDDGANQHDFGTELDGTETLSGTTFQYAHSGVTNTIVVQMIADGYEEIVRRFTLDSSNQTLTLVPIPETNT